MTTRPALLLIAMSIVAGCSAEAAHPDCKDEASTTAYSVKWQDDLAAARKAGKLSMDRVTELQGRTYEKFGLLKDQNYAAWCVFIDGVRKDGGF